MRILEALRTLEAATLECKLRPIDTPEVRETLDLLEPYCHAVVSIEGRRPQMPKAVLQDAIPVQIDREDNLFHARLGTP